MAKGENRAKLKEGAVKTTEGLKRMTLGVGHGIKDFAAGTLDAIVHPDTIPHKIDTCIDAAIVKPTRRVVEFLDDSTHRVLDETDRAWNDRVKAARGGARRLKVVFAQPFVADSAAAGGAPVEAYPKSEEDAALIAAALRENVVFAGLSKSAVKRSGLVDAFEGIDVPSGSELIREGTPGDYFYVVAEGTVTFAVGDETVGTAGEGSSFGELALLHQAPRAATVAARTDCRLFRLDQSTFKRILARQMRESHEEVIGILRKVPLFEGLDGSILNRIAGNLRTVTYNDGDVLVSREKGTPPTFYIVKEGLVDTTGNEIGGSKYKDVSFKAGECFGHVAMVENRWAIGMATARGKVVVLALDRDQFIRAAGNDIESLVRKGLDKKKLALIPYGKRKAPAAHELDLLVDAVEEKKFPKGHVFFTEGRRCLPALYLVRRGKASIRSSGHSHLLAGLLGVEGGGDDGPEAVEDPRAIGPGGYFGNDTLGANETGEFGRAMYTVTALEDVEAGVLDLDAIKRLSSRPSREEEKIGSEDLDMVRILGAGTFGKVWLVSRKRTKDAYALKVQVKKQLIEYNQAEGVIREKNIMELLDHPFIIKMVSSWKDEDKLYMLLKLYQGGELQSVIHTDTRDGIPEWAAAFYAANVLEGLSHMHRRNIVYRDLKPENVLLDSEGYTVIVDLGFAKIIKDKTFTFCGTPLYLAPEVIMQTGHDKGADHWSWGVMLYEMIVGMTPFYDGIVDQMGLFRNIVKCRMEFPLGDFISHFAKDLIKRMLTVNPHDRLGSFADAEKDIMNHQFFQSTDWQKLREKDVKVPFVPKVSDPLDGSNFDDYSMLEAKAKRERVQKLTWAEQKLFDKF